jgi:fructose-bisphosphate aldolase, class II
VVFAAAGPGALKAALDGRHFGVQSRDDSLMLPSPDLYVAMLEGAAAGRYAFPAINVTSSQTLNAAMRGFAEAGSDGIVQVTVGGARYFSGAVKDGLNGARAFAALGRELAGSYPVATALHTDHCPPADVDSFLWPLLADSAGRVERRERPLFHSHMFDGSTLPLEANLRLSAGLLDRCRELGIVLEVECGVVGGEEDGVGDEAVSRDRLYTTSEDLLRVAEALGTGERGRYLLAATFGNVHGVYAPGHVRLRPQILADGQEALERAYAGARFQYVFHGSSGSSPEELRAAVDNGVVKVNLDSETQYAFTRAAAEHMIDHRDGVLAPEPALGDKRAYDPRAWGAEAETAMAERVAEACEQLGSAGRSIGA